MEVAQICELTGSEGRACKEDGEPIHSILLILTNFCALA